MPFLQNEYCRESLMIRLEGGSEHCMGKREIKRSREDYLETILIVLQLYGACRVTDIAKQAGYSRASVSVAVKKLEEDGYIVRNDWRILLSDKGMQVAAYIYEKHKFFAEWFESIGIARETAEEDACLIEHVLSDESYRRIRDYIEKTEQLGSVSCS